MCSFFFFFFFRMTIGAVDTTLYSGTITYTPSSASDYWEIPLDNVSLNGNSLNISSTDTLIDSGEKIFQFPPALPCIASRSID